jgi:hypothetical protein
MAAMEEGVVVSDDKGLVVAPTRKNCSRLLAGVETRSGPLEGEKNSWDPAIGLGVPAPVEPTGYPLSPDYVKFVNEQQKQRYHAMKANIKPQTRQYSLVNSNDSP